MNSNQKDTRFIWLGLCSFVGGNCSDRPAPIWLMHPAESAPAE